MVEVKSFRCPVCRCKNLYVVCNGHVVAGTGGVCGGSGGFEINYCGKTRECIDKADDMIERCS
jgi:hypothetical protein